MACSYMEIEYDSTGTRPNCLHTFTGQTDYDDWTPLTWDEEGQDVAYLDIGASDGILTPILSDGQR